MKLYPYNQGSKGAKALAEALGIKRIKHVGENIVKDDVIINWGSSDIKRGIRCDLLLNQPYAIAGAANKLTAFQIMQGQVSTPEWSESRDEAFKWLAEGACVVVRHKLNGHSGEGIEILSEQGEHGIPDAPLYTKYVKKEEEYRLHVFRGEVFFVQRKARKLDVPKEQVNWQVRNLAGGFIFANKDVDVDDIAKEEARNAVRSLGLDFGAVDIILGKDDKWYVLEVNTACGLEGTTLEKYVEQFNKFK